MRSTGPVPRGEDTVPRRPAARGGRPETPRQPVLDFPPVPVEGPSGIEVANHLLEPAPQGTSNDSRWSFDLMPLPSERIDGTIVDVNRSTGTEMEGTANALTMRSDDPLQGGCRVEPSLAR